MRFRLYVNAGPSELVRFEASRFSKYRNQCSMVGLAIADAVLVTQENHSSEQLGISGSLEAAASSIRSTWRIPQLS
jgi:hypothetical protein